MVPNRATHHMEIRVSQEHSMDENIIFPLYVWRRSSQKLYIINSGLFQQNVWKLN